MPNMMIRPVMKIFQTAAAAGSFTEAAALLGMSQPNVTQQLAGLEKTLKVRLFHRTGRRVKLTAAGEELYRECRHLFALEEDILRKIRHAGRARRSFLLGGTSVAGSFLLPGMAAAFRQKFTNHSLHLKINDPDTLCRELASGGMELVLTDEPCAGDHFFYEPYCHDRLVPVFAPGYAEPRFSLAEYLERGGKFILNEPGTGTRRAFSDFLRAHGIPEPDAENITEVNSLDAEKLLAQAACGMAVVSSLAAENEVRSGFLRQGEFTEGEIVREIGFLYLPDGDQRFIRQFIDFCRRHRGISMD